jgi:hypothetical protein
VTYRLIAAIAIAVGLSVATAVPAGAAAQRTPQVNGDLLAYALVPDSAFGSSFSSDGSSSTGRKLLPSSHARYYVPKMSCASFEDTTRVGEYGDTAGAWDEFYNPDWEQQYPTVIRGLQSVNQFASDSAAMTFYRQVLAKYQGCQAFTQSNPGDHSPGGGTIDVSATAITRTAIAGNPAFQVVQDAALSEDLGLTYFENDLWVVSGPDVFNFWDLSGTNDEPWPGLMAQLIRDVQHLR